MSSSINILMTGGGAPGAAGILKCLRQEKNFKVTVADADTDVAGRYMKQNIPFETIPVSIAPLFAETVLDLCRSKGINIIIPLVTRELIPFATHKNDFEKNGIRLPLSTLASLQIANNKSSLYEFLQWRDIPLPAFKVVETAEQFKEAVKELGYPGKTICFKPSISNGSRGFRIISEHMNELDLLFNHKPSATYLSLPDAVRILSSGKFPELLVSEFLPGEEYSVDCLANQGDAILVAPRLRKKMINGISVEGEFVKNQQVISYCTLIIKELQLHGNIGIQIRRSSAGEPLILEINPRVQGSISTGLGAGINLPVLAVKQELGLPIEANELTVKWGTKFTRFWDELFY